jgi:demethylspheroidene O-methyltransferase
VPLATSNPSETRRASQPSRAATTPTPDSLLDRLYAARDRLVASPAFQRWAAAFPLTRRIGDRHARALFDLTAGFVYSQVLLAAVRLNLLDHLAEGPLAEGELARRLDLSAEAASRLIEACASLGLLARRRDGRIGLAMRGAALRGNPGALAMIEHHALVYRDLADPVALLRGEARDTALSRYWPYAVTPAAGTLAPDATDPYTRLMAASQATIAEDVLAAYRFDRHRRLLDVGGGDGTFLTAAGRHCPHLDLSLFDLPSVAERARARLTAAGLGGRAVVTGGDFAADALPAGADVVTLIRVLLDHTDAGALGILRRIRDVMPSNGMLVIAEPMRRTPGFEPVGDAYFGFYLLAMGRGRARSADELTALLRAAGFDAVTAIRTRRPVLVSMLCASPR